MFRQQKAARQATRTLQTLRGAGKVYAGDEFVCEARYSVSVNQGIVYAGSQPSTGVTDIRGTLILGEGERRWKPGTRLSLKLEDGRTAAFVTLKSKAPAGVYNVQVNELSQRS